MTAMMLFKLIEKKQLNLNDKLSKFYPKIPNAEKITIAQLLHHSSGLGDYVTGKNTMKWLTEKFLKNRS
jgi:CubicO group peptidase (beta-lactamase class C family)